MGAFDIFLEREEIVTNHLAEAAKQIPQDKIAWKPCEKALPWLYLIHHSSIHRKLFLKLFRGEPHDFPGCYSNPDNQAKTPAEAVEDIMATWEEFKSYIQSQPDDFALRGINPPWGGPSMTAEEMLWWMYEGNVHHRGQAWVYARMNGITPPAIWGTEQP